MSLKEDEFYCGSEESEKERINPFRQEPEQEKQTNPLLEAIDKALGLYNCGTKENPHVFELLEEGITSFDLARIELTGTLWRCTKCGSYPALPFTRISRLTIELVEDQ